LKWRAAKVIGPAEGASGDLVLEKNPSGTTRWAGETPVITACARDPSWDEQYHLSGGTGPAPPRFAATLKGGSYPTIWFETPIVPSDWGWKIGDRIAFCIQNTNTADTGPGASGDAMQRPYGTSEYMSINNCHRNARPLRKSTYKYLAYSGVYLSLNDSAGNRRYAPALLVGHRGSDGKMHVKGNAYQGDTDANIAFTRIRQIIYIPNDSRWNNRRIIGFDAGVWRNSTSIGGNVTLRLSRAGSSPGAGGDDGTLLGSRVIAASVVEVGGGRGGSDTAVPQTVVNMGTGDFQSGAVLTVKPGEAYYLELIASVSGYTIGHMLNYIGRTPVGLIRADHEDNRNRFQTKSGTGNWTTSSASGVQPNYNILGVGLHLRA